MWLFPPGENRLFTSDVLEESFLELGNPGGVEFVKESTDSTVDNRNLNNYYF